MKNSSPVMTAASRLMTIVDPGQWLRENEARSALRVVFDNDNSGDDAWSAPRRLRPRERRFEAGERDRKLLGVRAGHVFQLAREDIIDGRLISLGEPAEHVALI